MEANQRTSSGFPTIIRQPARFAGGGGALCQRIGLNRSGIVLLFFTWQAAAVSSSRLLGSASYAAIPTAYTVVRLTNFKSKLTFR
jgi:hypothetical protein